MSNNPFIPPIKLPGGKHVAAKPCAQCVELHAALKNIVDLDNDAHPGLHTWHDARVQAHKKAETLIAQVQA